MRIGKNELEIMELLKSEENHKMAFKALKAKFKQDCERENYRSKALSRALYSLTKKELVMKYAQISDRHDWEFDKVIIDSNGNRAMLMRKPYDGKMPKKMLGRSSIPDTKLLLGLTEKGKRELEKRR